MLEFYLVSQIHKSLSELFEDWGRDYKNNFENWKHSPQFEVDKKNYDSYTNIELHDLAMAYLGTEENVIYWFNNLWPSFNHSPSDLFKTGHGQMVKDYLESKLRGIPE